MCHHIISDATDQIEYISPVPHPHARGACRHNWRGMPRRPPAAQRRRGSLQGTRSSDGEAMTKVVVKPARPAVDVGGWSMLTRPEPP